MKKTWTTLMALTMAAAVAMAGCSTSGAGEEALAQIRAKGYAEPFAKDKRTVYRIGVNFSDEIRNIQDIKIETGK